MGKAQSLKTKVDRLMKTFQATDRPVYKRILTRSGGDPVLGKGVTVTAVDTLLAPQPVISSVSKDSPLLFNGTSVYPSTDLVMVVSPSALSLSDLRSKGLEIVLKDGTHEELYLLVAFVPDVLEGQDIAFTCLIRSVAR